MNYWMDFKEMFKKVISGFTADEPFLELVQFHMAASKKMTHSVIFIDVLKMTEVFTTVP